MKKKIAYSLVMASIFILSGCADRDSFLDKKIEAYIMRASGITEDVEFQQYEELITQGVLNSVGEYNELEKEEYCDVQKKEKQVRVSIANNEFLDVHYYLDAAMKEKVKEDVLYLNPGDVLYASQPSIDNAYSNTYVFSEFQIFEYDEEGNKGKLFSSAGDESAILEIPLDYTGTELAIFPIGKYEKRGLTFNAFYRDENGISRNVPGVWYVNDIACIENTANVGASDSYIVRYEYDPNMYYYVEATPSPFSSEIPGVVEFKEATALKSTDTYYVRLHQYMKASFATDDSTKRAIKSVEVNGKKIEDYAEEGIKGLKKGDKLVIQTKDDYRLMCDGITIKEPEEIENGYQYTIVIPESNYTENMFRAYKTDLQVSLDKSVGGNTTFAIKGSGLNKENCQYEKQTFGTGTVIYDGTIGMDENIVISATDNEIEPGYALKVYVKKTDGSKQTIETVEYISELPGKAEIELYNGSGKNTNLNKIFKKVSVEISLVEIACFEAKEISNGTCQVKLENGRILSDGDVAEDSQKVSIMITPNTGFYLLGKNLTNDIYMEEMTLANYLKKIDNILNKLETKRLIEIAVDSSDTYGICKFLLNGKEINGTTSLRQEDELVMEYELTNDDYEIKRDSDGIFGGLNDVRKNIFSKNREKIEIPISYELDGACIDRETYIEVAEKEKK